MNTSLPAASSRIDSIDALRGFALVAILLVHLPEYLIYDVYGIAPGHPSVTSGFLQSMSTPIADSLFFLFAGKSYSIFALLFGVTFAIQYNRRRERGGDFAGRYAWRLLWLALFGCLNAIFFPAGDVLLSFAIFGLVLIPFRSLSAGRTAMVGFLFLLQPLQLYYGLRTCLSPDWQAPSMLQHVNYDSLKAMMTEADFPRMIWTNLTTGQFASFAWGVDAGRMTQMPGLFLMGCALSKAGRFRLGEENASFWIRVLVTAVFLCVVFHIGNSMDYWPAPITAAFKTWYDVSFSAVWIALFLVLYQSSCFQRLTSYLRPFGRMSLTNYIMQAVVGSMVFFPWGLGLITYLDPTICVAIGLLLGILQIAVSNLWMSHFKQGPFETVWHKLTWIGSKRRA